MPPNLNGILLKTDENEWHVRKKIVPNFSNRWHCKHRNMHIKIPAIHKTYFTCYKNAGYTAFLHDYFIEWLRSACKAFLQEKWVRTSSSADVPDTQEYEKSSWSNDCAGSVKNDSEIQKDGFFWFGRGRKRNDSTVAEDVTTQQYKRSRTVV